MPRDKIAVITGASTGIGRAVAVELAKQKTFVFLVARTKERLIETKRLIVGGGGKAEVFLADLSSVASINEFIEQIKIKTNRVDILVNVAGIWHGKDEIYAGLGFEKFSQQVILDTYSVGLIAPTLLAHGFTPLMPKKSKIVNISGTFESGAKGWLPYYVSKRAIEDLTKGLAEELKDKEIQVNCISPSDTATEQYKKYFPQFINEANDPKDVAKEVAFLCSDIADITGSVFVVKKGQEPFNSFHY